MGNKRLITSRQFREFILIRLKKMPFCFPIKSTRKGMNDAKLHELTNILVNVYNILNKIFFFFEALNKIFLRKFKNIIFYATFLIQL